jgi:hypothetical protein
VAVVAESPDDRSVVFRSYQAALDAGDTNAIMSTFTPDGYYVAALAELPHETAEHHGSFEAAAPPHDW